MESSVVNNDESQKAQPEYTAENAALYHKAGHIVAAWFLKHSDITTIVLMNKLKIACCPVPQDNFQYSTEEEYFDHMCVYLGGFISEYIVFGSGSWMSQYDLRVATRLGVEVIHQFRKRTDDVPFGTRVVDLVFKAFRVTKKLLKDHTAEIRRVFLMLLQRRTLRVIDIDELLGPRICMHTHLTKEYRDHTLAKDNSDIPIDIRDWTACLLVQRPSFPLKYILAAILFLVLVAAYFIHYYLTKKLAN